MLPGHLDDVITGLCFQMMNLLPHHPLQTSLVQFVFNGHVMPQDATENLNGSFPTVVSMLLEFVFGLPPPSCFIGQLAMTGPGVSVQ